MSTPIRFILSVINFGLLVGGFYLLLRRASRNFFYARAMRVRKEETSAVWELRQARVHVARSRRMQVTLEEDIASRRAMVDRGAQQERAHILDEAGARVQRIIAKACQRADDERAHAADLVGQRLLTDAFERAERLLRAGIRPEQDRALIDRGLADLAGMSGFHPQGMVERTPQHQR